MSARIRKIKRFVYLVVASIGIIIVISWCALYLYARSYQGRAKSLILSTQSLRPGSSTFYEAKQLADQYREFVSYSNNTCILAKCDFEIRMANWFAATRFFNAISYWDYSWQAWAAALARKAGLRPVTTYVHIAVRNGIVVRSHAGYGFRTGNGASVGAGTTAVKEFYLADRCKLIGSHSRDVESIGINFTSPGGGYTIMRAYPMSATPETIRSASAIDLSCMTSLPECPNPPYSMLPSIHEKLDRSSTNALATELQLMKQCETMTPEELNHSAFGSVD